MRKVMATGTNLPARAQQVYSTALLEPVHILDFLRASVDGGVRHLHYFLVI
jgi:hypothetical protein